jgi:hypothetical protein
MAIISLDVDASRFVRETPTQIVERARAQSPDHYNRAALDAFEAGEWYEPPSWEYGLGSGNFIGDLVSRDGILYHVHRQSNYRQKLIPIMKNEEAERVAYLKANCGEVA